MIGAQPAKRDVADRGLDVAVDEPGVPVPRGGTDLAAFVWDPRVGEVLAERDRTGRCCEGGVAFAVESSGELFGFLSVVAHGMPSSAFPSGEWVEAVVSDDVEAGLALHDVAHPPISTTSTPTRSSRSEPIGVLQDRARHVRWKSSCSSSQRLHLDVKVKHYLRDWLPDVAWSVIGRCGVDGQLMSRIDEPQLLKNAGKGSVVGWCSVSRGITRT